MQVYETNLQVCTNLQFFSLDGKQQQQLWTTLLKPTILNTQVKFLHPIRR